jgi:hypothetical protein
VPRGAGLVITNVSSTRYADGLVVEGDITNRVNVPRTLPHLRVVLRDASHDALDFKNADPPREQLLPGEISHFVVRFLTVPDAVTGVVVSFVGAEQGAELGSDISAPAAVSSYDEGLKDRTDWEQWLAGLSGPFRSGAFWWSGQRSLQQPGVCNGPDSFGNLEFAAGCEAARVRLTPTDLKRKANPDYRRGWNSYSTETPPLPQATGLTASTAETKSANLCGHRMSYVVDRTYSAEFGGAWTGIWNNASRLCGALIVNKISYDGRADITYIYGPSGLDNSIQWKQQHVVGMLRDGVLSFQDDQGSTFRFGLRSPLSAGSLDAQFISGSAQLSASFERLN